MVAEISLKHSVAHNATPLHTVSGLNLTDIYLNKEKAACQKLYGIVKREKNMTEMV